MRVRETAVDFEIIQKVCRRGWKDMKEKEASEKIIVE